MRRNRLHLQWLACQRRGRAPCPPQLWNPCHFSFWASRAIPAGTHAGASVSLGRRLVLRLFFRSEEHTSELQSLMRISYAVFCLKKKIIYTIKSKSNYYLYISH